jgi:hypothetical protein
VNPLIKALFPALSSAEFPAGAADPAQVAAWDKMMRLLRPVILEHGGNLDEKAMIRIASEVMVMGAELQDVILAGGLSDAGMVGLAQAARGMLSEPPSGGLVGTNVLPDPEPVAAAPFAKGTIADAINALLPIPQLVELMPHVWSPNKKELFSVDQQIAALEALAQDDPASFEMIMKGDLLSGERGCAGGPHVDTVRRQAIIWLFADLVHTARLIDSIETTGTMAHALSAAWANPGGQQPATANVGAFISAGESHARALAELAGIQGNGPGPKNWDNDKLTTLDRLLRPLTEGNGATIAGSQQADEAAAWVRASAPQIDGVLQLLAKAHAGELKDSNGRTVRPYISQVRHAIGAASTTALAFTGLRVSQALAQIVQSLKSPSRNLTLVLPALTHLEWRADTRLSGDVAVAMHLCRVHLLADDDPPVKSSQKHLNWKTISLADRSSYLQAKSELSSRALYKCSVVEVRNLIRAIVNPAKRSVDECSEADLARRFLDISFVRRA